MNIFVSEEQINISSYIIATYYLASSTNLRNAAWELAIGQSVGNPKIRSKWETEKLFNDHSCLILADENSLMSTKSGTVKIAFPVANINLKEDGVSQLLCQLMGGQLDIDDIQQCHLLQLKFPLEFESTHRPYTSPAFLGPKYGITGVRSYTNCYNKPLLGGIIKPKLVPSVGILSDMVKEMVDGGVNFIKEDEIMSNPDVCPLEKRIPEISKIIDNKKVIYAACINGDANYVLERAKLVYELGGNGIHLNFWSGLGTYKAIRELDLPLFLHFQKSGDKILTNKSHDYHIDWSVICDLAGLMGVDFIHSGMWGGYLSDSEEELNRILKILRDRNVVPALSCGMHAGLINSITEKFGIDYMANVGGALHGHPDGTKAGVKAMRQAIDKNYDKEYFTAIQKWGLKI